MKNKAARKIIAAALAMVMAGTLFTGCGGKEPESADAGAETKTEMEANNEEVSKANEGEEAEKETDTAASETAEVGGKLIVPLWDYASQPLFQKLIEGFEQEYPEVEVEVVDIPSNDFVQKQTIMLNGGNDLDIVFVKGGSSLLALAQKGQLLDLTEYIGRDSYDLAAFNGLEKDMVMDGKQVALPLSGSYYVLFYNKDLFDAADVPYPGNDMTWEEFEEMAKKLTSGEGNEKKYGALIHTWQSCVQSMAVATGEGTILGPDYSFMKPYYEMVLRMQEEGSIYDYAELKSGNIHYSGPFLQGNVALLPMGSWFISQIRGKIESGESNVNWGIAAYPHTEGMEAGATIGSYTPVAINVNSKNKEAAWAFLKYVTGEKAAEDIVSVGELPSRMTEETLKEVGSLEGMPEGTAEAMKTSSIFLERPYDQYSDEVDQMMGEEHDLMMIGEISVDEGLAEMSERSKEIQGIE